MNSETAGAVMGLRTWGWRAAFVLACLLQLYGLYAPQQPGPPGIPYLDKLGHFSSFAVVAYLGVRVGIPVRWLVGVLAAHAVVSEFVQHQLYAWRSGDPFDTLADLAGLALGTWLGQRAVRSTNGAGRDMMGT